MKDKRKTVPVKDYDRLPHATPAVSLLGLRSWMIWRASQGGPH